jgi:hypothetical protein
MDAMKNITESETKINIMGVAESQLLVESLVFSHLFFFPFCFQIIVFLMNLIFYSCFEN